MKQQIEKLTASCLEQIKTAASRKELTDIKIGVLGKSGELTAILRNLKDLPAEQRPEAGKLVNEARERLESALSAKFEQLHDEEVAAKLASEKIDITIDKPHHDVGCLHPLNIVRNEIVDFFVTLGFIVTDSPEIETDYYNFEALNTPADHPARDVQDTFYINDHILLRSQTSTGQIRTMEKFKPPIKMISPGRVYRADDLDATHSPMFHQIEGLVVDKHITMCDLKGILDMFAQHFFDEKCKTRFRPSYFPFTEPSVEVDVSCNHCHGSGCRVCKGTGWIEILGAGMVNRNVLTNCNIDPDEYTGFAFGMGLERITNIIYNTDMRAIYENDIRFLKQFK